MKDRTDIFERCSVPRAMAVMAVPTIISQLITLVYNLADTWFIGQTGNPYMVAACSLCLPAYMIAVAFSNLYGTGGGSLISRLLGAKDEAEAGRVSAVSLCLAAATAAAYALGSLAFLEPYLRLLGASDNTLPFAQQYLGCVIVAGAVPTVLSITMSNLLRSIGASRQASFGLSMGGVLNIALDPLFMFVILPAGNEALGAGLATLLSNICSLAYYAAVYCRLRGTSVLRVLPKHLPSGQSFAALFSVGVPAALSLFLFDLTNIMINRLSAAHGDLELAAMGIVLRAERLPLNIGIGICLGMVPLLAYSYSARNFRRMASIFSFGRLAGLAVAAVCVVLYRAFGSLIMQAFIGDEETVRLGTRFIHARCFATPMMFLCFSMVHFFQATGKGAYSFLLAVVRQLVFNIPLLLLLDRLFGMDGIIWTQLVADTLTVAVSYLVYLRVRRKEGWQGATCPES